MGEKVTSARERDWLGTRGIPYAPEVYTGLDNDPPMEEAMIVAMSALMTNIDKPIYAFTPQMPPEVAAALFARYSRSPRPLRYVLAREFWQQADLETAAGKRWAPVNVENARSLFRRVLAEYGDDSVAQLGTVSIAAEMVSQLAVKEIEDGRFGGWLEKSSRYVDFGKKVNGRYLYYRPREIMGTGLADEYENLMDEAFGFYREAARVLRPYLEDLFPRGERVDEREYKASVRAKAFDIARVFLPMSTLTNVGMVLSAQAVESMVNKMMASRLEESRTVAREIKAEADQVIPSLLERVGEEKYGGQVRRYLSESRTATARAAGKVLERLDRTEEGGNTGVRLVWRDPGAVDKVAAAILYPHANADLGQIAGLVEGMSEAEKKELVDAYLTGRTDRRHKPGRAFEMADYWFSIRGNVGIWRDLQRQRLLLQQRQKLDAREWETPRELEEVQIGVSPAAQVYEEHMQKRAEFYERSSREAGADAAQYTVAFGNLMNWMVKANLRQLYHMLPLRAGQAGHPAYRRVAREMYYPVAQADPILALPMERFIDFSDEPVLERLTQLKRVREKLDRLGGGGGDTFAADE